jgi:exonuclease VII small subunit
MKFNAEPSRLKDTIKQLENEKLNLDDYCEEIFRFACKHCYACRYDS